MRPVRVGRRFRWPAVAAAALAIVAFEARDASAHHAAFYGAVFDAVDARDLGAVRPLFADPAWEGQRADVSGADLARRLPRYAKVERAEGWHGLGLDREGRRLTAIRLRCYEPEATEPVAFWLLAAHQGGSGNQEPAAWRIDRIVTDEREAARFLGRPYPLRPFRDKKEELEILAREIERLEASLASLRRHESEVRGERDR